MASDSKMIRDIEERLAALNLSPEEEAKRRRALYKAMEIEQSGFTSPDLDLAEGSILIGVCNGELCQATAREGQLWVNDKPFAAISAAAIEATGRPTQSGWLFWRLAYVPRKGFVEVASLRKKAAETEE